MRQYACRRDTHEAAIVDALRHAGATVQRLSLPGVPDLLIGYHGHNLLIEIKTAKGCMTQDEATWHALWAGQACVVRSPAEALEMLAWVSDNATPRNEKPRHDAEKMA